MRILAIRGHNLASLEDRFDIDLDAEPLRSAGLFAITGDTGAGKSTILDAMCLALYGDCPRLSSSGINDDVPDASGESIKSRDARAILRRGATMGEAQVDFLADDGEAYRAVWITRRARGRAEGRLQNVERALIRLSDQQLLETQLRAVNDRIAVLIGLTYDEFRRTVLLAQGDFDAFLRADTSDRAALLEKVTGTQIYRDISRRVYERDAAANAARQDLETRMGEHKLLSAEDRAQILEDIRILSEQLNDVETVQLRIGSDIRRHEEMDQANRRQAEAVSRRDLALTTRNDAAPDRDRLSLLERAEPLRADHELALEAGRAQERARAALSLAQNKLLTATEEDSLAQSKNLEAAAAHDAAEERFKEFGPIWSKATRLDGQIHTATEELAGANEALKGAVLRLSRAAADAKTLREQMDIHAPAKAGAEAALEKLPGFQPLADDWDRLQGRFGERARLMGIALKARADISKSEVTQQAASRDLGELEGLDQQDRAAMAAFDAQLTPLAVQITDLEAQRPNEQLSDLLASRSVVTELVTAAEKILTGTADLSGADTNIGLSEVALLGHQVAFRLAGEQIRAAEAVEAEIRSSLERAELALGQHAQLLRAQLVDGELCPVCGSPEHPNTDTGPFAAFVAEIRDRLGLARAKTSAANLASRTASDLMSGAASDLKVHRTTRERAAQLLARGQLDWSAGLAKPAIEAMRALLPSAPDPVALQDLLVNFDQRQTEIRRHITALVDLRNQREGLLSRRAALTAAVETRRAKIAQLSSALQESQNLRALASQADAAAVEQIEAIDRELDAALQPAKVSQEALRADPEAIRAKVDTLVGWHKAQTAKLIKAEAAIADLSPRISAAEIGLAHEVTRKADAEQMVRDRTTALNALRDARAPLLGGAATEAHRTTQNNERLRLAQEHARIRGIASEAAGKLAAAVATSMTATATMTDATGWFGIAQEKLERAIAESGMERTALVEALSVSRADVDALRAKLRLIAENLSSAEALLVERATDVEEKRVAGVPDRTRAELEQDLAENAALLRSGRERFGEMSGRIQRDDADRTRLSALADQIERALEVCDTWGAVNASIGSASGGKFAQVAQSVTLAVLVDRANDHLRLFNPRYRLALGGSALALHVIDQDMADEVRSTRSLSGGERFLVSLSLALALSGLGRRGGIAETLFIDEGFGSLDADSLDMAIAALEALQGQGRSIGVISHVEAMKERIPVQVRVAKAGAGRSTVIVELV